MMLDISGDVWGQQVAAVQLTKQPPNGVIWLPQPKSSTCSRCPGRRDVMSAGLASALFLFVRKSAMVSPKSDTCTGQPSAF